jgi:3-deoxy-D-manno-octulosonate 8-phosphate phosphatase (KDO 8-P phosphatase)
MDIKKNVIYCDCDGVLTDNKFWISSKGEVSKGFHTKDVRAIRELIANGFEFYIVTASSWAGLKVFAEKTGAVIIHERDKSKIDTTGCIVIGDDVWDLPMLNKARYVILPADSNLNLIGRTVHRSAMNGGNGMLSSIVEPLIKLQ